MKNVIGKRFAILVIMIIVLLCLPLCGLAADYERGRQVTAFNQGDETMVAILGDVATEYAAYPEFLKDWNGDGVLTAADYNDHIKVEWSVTAGSIASQEGFTEEEYDGTVYIWNPAVYLSGLQAEDNGKTVSMKLTNPDGDTFTSVWTLEYTGLVAGTPIVTVSEGDYSFTRTGKNRYKLTVQDGAEVSVDTMDSYDKSYAEYRELYANLYENATDGERTLISSRYKDTNWAITSDDEFTFTASADKQVYYTWSLWVVHQSNLTGHTSVRIDLEVVEKDSDSPAEYYNHEHSYYFNQNGELSVSLLGEMPEMYNGMSEFKRDWDGDGVITADECNKNVKIEWSTTAGKIASKQKFTASANDNTVVSNPVAWVTGLKAEDDGETVTMKLTNTNGDTFTADFTLYYSGWIHNQPIVTTDDADYEFVKTGKNHYKLTVADGANVSVDFTDYIDTNFDLVKSIVRKVWEIDPATEEATSLSQASFEGNEYSDSNNADTDDDELSFTVSAEDPTNYRCNFMVVVGENRMIANSNIYIDVKVRPGYMTADVPVYMMDSDNAQEIRCYGVMAMTHGESLSAEEEEAFWDLYEQVGTGEAKLTWHSDNSALNALIKANVRSDDPTYLRIRDEEMGLDEFQNETIIATYTKDGETVAEAYYNIQDTTIEMLTWHDPSIAPEATESTEYPFDAVYTINAVEGETVSIKMNYTYSGNIKYLWVLNGEQQQNAADNYRFVATMDHDGMVILNNAGRADFDNSLSTTMYEYAVQFIVNVEEAPEVPQGPLTADVNALMGESETDRVVFIFASDVLKMPGITQEEKNAWNDVLFQNGVTYRWYSEDSYVQSIIDKLGLQPDSNSLLTMTEDGDLSRLLGKTICCAVKANGEQTALINFHVADTYEMPTWVEPTSLPAFVYNAEEKAEITVAEGAAVTIQMNHKYSKPLIYRWFINEEEIEYSESAYSFTAALTDDGMKVRCVTSSGPIEEAGRSHGSSYEFVIRVLPKSDEEVYKVEYDEGISEVPAELANNTQLDTPAKIESTITIEVMAQAVEAGLDISGDQTEVYDVKLMYSEDGGVTWIEATEENWPESGKITVTLPYPEGTGQFTHNFVVAHMFTTTTADHKAGDIEYPAVTNTPQGIQFQVTSLSPIAIAWDEKPEVVTPPVPATGDSATPWLWLLGMTMAAVGCIMLGKRRQHN